MTRPTGGTGGTVHVGKAAAIIIVAALIGVLVLYKDSGGGGSVSAAERAAASAAFARANAITTTTTAADGGETEPTTIALRAPAEVKVIALNATKTAGQAGKATKKLTTNGYNALAPGNATAAVRNTNPSSVIYVVTPGYEGEAAAIATIFGLPASAVRAVPTPSPSPDIKPGVNIAVLIGTGVTL